MQTEQERGQKAFDLHNLIVNNEEARRKLLAKNAVLLAEMFEKEYYKDFLGDKNAEWAGYLGQIQLFYSRNQVYNYLRVYNKLTKGLDIDPEVWVEVPITRLMDVLPIIDARNYEDWFVKGLTLTTEDWNIETRKAKGLLTQEDEEEHDDRVFKICRRCGRKELIHEHVEKS